MKTDSQLLDENIARAITTMAQSIGRVVVDGRRTCVRCMHFNPQSEMCQLANQRPPARVIAYGCDSFVEDDIPF